MMLLCLTIIQFEKGSSTMPFYDFAKGKVVCAPNIKKQLTTIEAIREEDTLVCRIALTNNSTDTWVVPKINTDTCELEFQLLDKNGKVVIPHLLPSRRQSNTGFLAKFNPRMVLNLPAGSQVSTIWKLHDFYKLNKWAAAKVRVHISFEYPLEPDRPQFQFESLANWVKLPR